MVAGPGVRLQVRELWKLLGASWVSALVRLVACVGPDVLLEMRQLGELSLTNLTPEIKTFNVKKKKSRKGYSWKTHSLVFAELFLEMCSHVLLQVGALGEMSLTNITPETERKWCTRPMLFNKKFPCVLCIISSSTKKHIPNCLAAKFQSVGERVCGKWKAQLTCMVWCRDGFLCVVTSSWNSRRTCYTETQEKTPFYDGIPLKMSLNILMSLTWVHL